MKTVKNQFFSILVIMLMALSIVPAALAVTTIPTSGTLATDIAGGDAAWTLPSNALLSDGVFATASMAKAKTSDRIDFTGFGFAIPAGSVIDGIVVGIERKGAAIPQNWTDGTVKLLKAGVVVGSEHATTTPYGTTTSTELHGTISDPWGTTWTAADINAATFGVTYSAKRVDGSASGSPATVSVDSVRITITYHADTTAPVITVTGTNPLTVEASASYVDAGATALDDNDGVITASIVTTGSVDSDTPGGYSIHYNVADAAGNPAVEKIRTVTVTDTTAPSLTVLGSDPESVEYLDAYVDAGATATDFVDGDLTGSIVVGGDVVDTSILGLYIVTYDVVDAASNPATTVMRTVNVIDTTAPVITLNGDADVTIVVGSSYEDAGAVSTDAVDGVEAISTLDVVSTETLGDYVLHYNDVDAATNVATEVTRTVHVVAEAPAPEPSGGGGGSSGSTVTPIVTTPVSEPEQTFPDIPVTTLSTDSTSDETGDTTPPADTGAADGGAGLTDITGGAVLGEDNGGVFDAITGAFTGQGSGSFWLLLLLILALIAGFGYWGYKKYNE